MCAVYPDARNPFAYPELLDEAPRAVGGRRGVGDGRAAPDPDPIDVTAAVDRKIAALLCHVSQHPDPDHTATMVREWMASTAKQAGLPDGASAETFRVVNTR